MRRTALAVAVALAAYLLGAITVHHKLFPFEQARDVRRWIDEEHSVSSKLAVRDPSNACAPINDARIVTGNYTWQLLTDKAAYAARDGAGSVVHDGKMYLLGGWNPEDRRDFPRLTSNDVWESANGFTWTQVKPNSFMNGRFNPARDWEGRHEAGYVSHDGYMWILGGDVTQGRHQSDVWKSADGRTWQLVAPSNRLPWAPRALHMATEFNGYIWVLGGQTLPDLATSEAVGEYYYRDVWRSRDGISWERMATVQPMWSPRGAAAVTVFKGRMWVIGGSIYKSKIRSKRRVYRDVWSSADGVHWELATGIPEWGERGGFVFHDVAVFDDKLWLIGGARRLADGTTTENTNEIWFSENGAQWSRLPCSPIGPTHATAVFGLDDGLVIAAGNHMTREVWRLARSSSGDTRAQTASLALPEAPAGVPALN